MDFDYSDLITVIGIVLSIVLSIIIVPFLSGFFKSAGSEVQSKLSKWNSDKRIRKKKISAEKKKV